MAALAASDQEARAANSAWSATANFSCESGGLNMSDKASISEAWVHKIKSAVKAVELAWWVLACIWLALAVLDYSQVLSSLGFVGKAVVHTFGFLLLSVGLTAYAKASGADSLIAKAFSGPPALAILSGALIGALSPFCSCGVVPVVLALLSMGVPVSAVMAFWLASPLMDPSMFVMTSATLGLEFAIAKTVAAVGIGLMGGWGTLLLDRIGLLGEPLRQGVGNGGCSATQVRKPQAPVWRIWHQPARVSTAWRSFKTNAATLSKWLLLAFTLESLMVAYLPADLVGRIAGGTGLMPVVWATLVGIPSYLNGYAALPLVKGLMAQGLAPGAAMAFLVGGGVTSIPAAMAVFGVTRLPVFLAYLLFGVVGAILSGVFFGFWIH